MGTVVFEFQDLRNSRAFWPRGLGLGEPACSEIPQVGRAGLPSLTRRLWVTGCGSGHLGQVALLFPSHRHKGQAGKTEWWV